MDSRPRIEFRFRIVLPENWDDGAPIEIIDAMQSMVRGFAGTSLAEGAYRYDWMPKDEWRACVHDFIPDWREGEWTES